MNVPFKIKRWQKVLVVLFLIYITTGFWSFGCPWYAPIRSSFIIPWCSVCGKTVSDYYVSGCSSCSNMQKTSRACHVKCPPEKPLMNAWGKCY